MAVTQRRTRRGARIALVAFAFVFARAQSDTGTRLDPGPSFAVVSQSPLEVRFRGIALRSARTDVQQNQIALDFVQPVDGALFDRLQQTVPDWIDMAYGGYDNAVIRARSPVQFLTRNESDGFSIRFVPAQPAAEPPLRGEVDRPPPPLEETQRTDTPFALRGSDAMGSAVVRIATDYRHSSRGNVYALRYAGSIPVGSGFRIVGSARAALGSGDHVRHLDGTISPLRKSVISGSLGVGYDIDENMEVRGEAIYSAAGYGGLLAARQQTDIAKLGIYAAWRAPYLNNTEEIADRGSHDIARIFGTVRFFPGFWGRAEGRYERFGVKGDSNVATTAGFTAGLRYMPDWFTIPVGIAYDVDGDYVLDAHHYLDPPLVPFVPMNIRTREVHALSGFVGIPLGDDVSMNLFGGYAADRYGSNGGFGGGDIAIAPADGWKLSLGGLYSQVPNRQSAGAPVISASVRLVYDLSSAPFDPFTPGFLPEEI